MKFLSLFIASVNANPFAHLFPDIEVRIADFNCWECRGNSYQECESRAQLVTCPQMHDDNENTWSCGISERKSNGAVTEVWMGCQQTKNCQREWRANFICTNCFSWNFGNNYGANTYECFGNDLSHCRQCCGTSGCNESWRYGVLDSEIEWSSNSEHRYINHHLN